MAPRMLALARRLLSVPLLLAEGGFVEDKRSSRVQLTGEGWVLEGYLASVFRRCRAQR